MIENGVIEVKPLRCKICSRCIGEEEYCIWQARHCLIFSMLVLMFLSTSQSSNQLLSLLAS